MLSSALNLPSGPTLRPTLVLVPGAAHTARVWTLWQRELAARGWPSRALDLRGHGESEARDLSHTSLHDYVEDIGALAGQLKRPPVLVGWSMGGTVALLAAAEGIGAACVALDPNRPAREPETSAVLRQKEMDPSTWGITVDDPPVHPLMPDLDPEERAIVVRSLCRESQMALDEQNRRRVVIQAMPCPALIVQGTAGYGLDRESYDGLWFEVDRLTIEGASHWGLVLNRRVLPTSITRILGWIESHIGDR